MRKFKHGFKTPGFNRGMKEKVIRKLSNLEKGWIAGCIDSDGSITILKVPTPPILHYKRRYVIQTWIKFSNTNRDVVQKFRDVIGAGQIVQTNLDPKGTTLYYTWTLYPKYAIKSLLLQIKDILIVKKERALLMLQFCESRIKHLQEGPRAKREYSDEEIAILKRFRELNEKKGVLEMKRKMGDINATPDNKQAITIIKNSV